MSLICLHDSADLKLTDCCHNLVCSSCSRERGMCASCSSLEVPLQTLPSNATEPSLFAATVYPDFGRLFPAVAQIASYQPPASHHPLYPPIVQPSALVQEPHDATPHDAYASDHVSLREPCPYGCGHFPRDELANHVRLLHSEIEDILARAREAVSRERAEKFKAQAVEAAAPGGTVTHDVRSTDTLAGIALYYNVTKEAIKRANRMNSDELAAYRTLVIPTGRVPTQPMRAPPPAAVKTMERKQREKLLQLFCDLGRCTVDEALYYLDAHSWAFDKAMQQHKSDLQWDLEQKIIKSEKRSKDCKVQ